MPEAFNETTDLYLQMLRRAQEVEDPRLVSMILERLTPEAPPLAAAGSGCIIIPFPPLQAGPEAGPDKPRFWPRVAVAQICYILVFYALVVAGHSFFN
jgi:hypothetical protein